MISLKTLLALTLAATCARAQTPAATAPASPDDPQQPHGTVLFQSHGDSPSPDADRKPLAPANVQAPDLPDSVRAAVTVTSYDLEAHLRPAASALSIHAVLTVRNDGPTPIPLLPLQISSTLHWETVSLTGATHTPVTFLEHPLETDLDHTGVASEAILTLPHPLAPGAILTLDTFYSGTLPADSTRLTRIGASPAQAAAADWDSLTPTATRLRGFGNVLWYPVASPPRFLGQGNDLFAALGHNKLTNQAVTARLRLSVEYLSDPPTAVWFAGRRQPLNALSDNSAAPVANFGGIATADFAAAPIGFRTLDLFLIPDHEQPAPPTVAAPADSSSSQPVTPQLLAVSTANDAAVPRLLALADEVSPLLIDWLGQHPITPLTVLDNPGQPYEDAALLVAPIDALASDDAAPAMAHSLTHAWISTGQPWIDEGLAQFLSLEWTERTLGREAAILKLQDLVSPLALGEPVFPTAADSLPTTAPGDPLINTGNDIFYRRKAAAVFFMLRDLVGEANLKAALITLASQPPSAASPTDQATAFRKLLEGLSHTNLNTFFDDWVLHDRGLPDLTIADVTPRPLPAGKGHDSGWLLAVTVRNAGAAIAEVPLTVHAGTFITTRHMRIPGFSSFTDRIFTEAQPTSISVNDGSVPEARTSTHTRDIVIHDKDAR